MSVVFWGATLTRDQFYVRYHYLAQLEEELYDQGKTFSEMEAQELSELAKLVTKERQSILYGKEKVTVKKNCFRRRYYYVQFENPRLSELKTLIQGYLRINSLSKMIEAFESTDWYRKRIQCHITIDYTDTLTALNSYHQGVMDIIKIFKNRLSTTKGEETFHTHGEFLINYFWSFVRPLQDSYVNESTLHLLQLIRHHDGLIDKPQEFVDTFSQAEERAVGNLSGLGENLQVSFRRIDSIVKDAFHRLTLELAAFTEAKDSKRLGRATYEIYEVNSIYPQVQFLKTKWKARFGALAKKSAPFTRFLVNAHTEQDLLERSLNRLSVLHAACIQNELLRKKIKDYYNRERECAPVMMIHPG